MSMVHSVRSFSEQLLNTEHLVEKI